MNLVFHISEDGSEIKKLQYTTHFLVVQKFTAE